MKWTLSAIILLTITAKSQTIDTLPNAKAYLSTYIPIYQYGVMANGHPYAVGLQYSLNPTFPYWIVRIDLVTKQITRKTMDGTISYPRAYWTSGYDSSGNFVLPFNTTDFHTRLIDFKNDSIEINDLGLVFKDHGDSVVALTYSFSIGSDGNTYFGAKGNPYVSYYDRATQQMHYYNAINDYGIDWVLSVTGDANYIYAVTGQNDSCNFWTINKLTGEKHNLNKVPSYTRQTIYCGNVNGVSKTFFRDPYVNCFYRVDNGVDTVRVPFPESSTPVYYEVNTAGQPTVNSFFDAATSKLQYVVNGVSDNVDIPSNFSQTTLQLVYVDRDNANIIYPVGALYGDVYKYSIAQDSIVALGHTGYNLYSGKKLNDSIYFIAGYPGGTLMEWNANQAWTCETYVNGVVIHATDTSANPHIIYQFKDSAGFQHPSSMILDTTRHLVICAGDVIRVDSSCSIGVYNYQTKIGYGYDYHKIGRLSLSGITEYGNKILMSTAARFVNNDTAKIYLYDPITNTMTDSLGFGLTDYGAQWAQGEQLVGVGGTTFYKVNLSNKKLIYQQSGTGAPKLSRIQDEKFMLNGGTAPAGWGQYKTSNYNNFIGIGNGTYFSISGVYLIRNKMLANQTIDLNTAEGKQKYIYNLLYNQ